MLMLVLGLSNLIKTCIRLPLEEKKSTNIKILIFPKKKKIIIKKDWIKLLTFKDSLFLFWFLKFENSHCGLPSLIIFSK